MAQAKGGVMRFIAFDLETTGTMAGVDKIVEIGAIRFNGGEPGDKFSTLIDPQRSIPPGASQVNGIFDDMVKGKPLIKDILEPFAEFCGEDPIVAHNAPFDTQFLTAAIKKYETVAPKGTVLDTLPIARKNLPGLPNYKLATLVQHFKLSAGKFHRAEEDAAYCGHLFWRLILKISPNGQVPMENLIALTGKNEFRFPQVTKQHKQMSFIDMNV